MKSKLRHIRQVSILERLIAESLVGDHVPVAFVMDMDHFDMTLQHLVSAFPEPTQHTLAVKANPLVNLLTVAAKGGFGAECASVGEIQIARSAGIPPGKIVYDSPVKSKEDLKQALRLGIYINIDNPGEFEKLLQCVHSQQSACAGIGLRINPETGMGRFKATSTATIHSKFGMTCRQAETLVAENSKAAEFIRGLHVHTGSQGIPVHMLIQGITTCVNLAEKLNRSNQCVITVIDIGGGLPIAYHDAEESVSFQEYAALIRKEIPEIFNYKIITEFGRSVFGPSGLAVCQIESVKEVKGRRIALVHAGADLFLRSAYMDWYHRILVCDNRGALKQHNLLSQDIAGPLCFSGDFIARERKLPLMEAGDWIIVCDAGAYTFSMWSIYNSRAFPPVYGYSSNTGFRCLHPGHDADYIAGFWK